jgi:hypothetical protein
MRIDKDIKAELISLTGVILILFLCGGAISACSQKPSTAEEIKAEADYKAQTALMKANRTAMFEQQATLGDNCVIGEASWYTSESSYAKTANIVICKGEPTLNVSYRVRSGKSTRQVDKMVIGANTQTKEELEAELEKIKKEEAERKEKADALEKLTPREKEMLGLK